MDLKKFREEMQNGKFDDTPLNKAKENNFRESLKVENQDEVILHANLNDRRETETRNVTYRASKNEINKAKERSKNKKKLSKKARNAIIATLTALGIAFAATETYNAYENQTLTISEVRNAGLNVEEYGVDENQVSQLEELATRLKDKHISKEELIDLSYDLDEYMIKLGKQKLAPVLDVDENDIRFYKSSEHNSPEEILLRDYKEYVRKYADGENMSKEMAEFIGSICDIQVERKLAKNRNKSTGDLKNACEQGIKVAQWYAASTIEIDSNGNLDVTYGKDKDILPEKMNDNER